MVHSIMALVAALLFLVSSASATFNASSKTNVAVYWGQGPYQGRLLETCQNPNIDIINLGFVNVFPDQGPGGYPGTNFGDACTGTVYTHDGVSTDLLSGCTYIGEDIKTCQKTYGKKILLSLGGGYPTNQYIVNSTSAVNFAKFLWGAFGPEASAWTAAGKPRPFGTAVVDGFDFDIESELSTAPTYDGKAITDYRTRGYGDMIATFKQILFKKDTSKAYYISAAPQCIVPDAHFGTLVTTHWFDFLFVQFYNTEYCSARAGIDYVEGSSSTDISFTSWTDIKFHNPNAKVYIGLPANTNASGSAEYYLNPGEAHRLIRRFYDNTKFGGIMLWEATYAANNVICGKNYPTWIKRILTAVAADTTINTATNNCPNKEEACFTCPKIPKSTAGRCGANYGQTCAGSSFGQCCDANGQCSSSFSVCSSTCDSRYTNCTYAKSVKQSKRSASFANLTLSALSTTSSSQVTVLSASDSASSSLSSSSALINTTTPAVASPLSSATSSEMKTVETASSKLSTSSASSQSSSTSSSIAVAATDAATAKLTTSSSTGVTNATSSEQLPNPKSTDVPTTPNTTSTISVSVSTEMVTVYSTLFITRTESFVTETITSLIPVATKTIVISGSEGSTQPSASSAKADVDAALTTSNASANSTDPATTADEALITPTAVVNSTDLTTTTVVTDYVTETITTCASSVSDCTQHPESATVTSTVAKIVDVYTTVIFIPAATATTTTAISSTATSSTAEESTSTKTVGLTSYKTAYYTTIVDVLYASSDSLYNPHSEVEEHTTSTTTMTMKSTMYLTETFTKAKETTRSTRTVTSTLTVVPYAAYPSEPKPTDDTHVYSPAEQAAQVAEAAAQKASASSSKSVSDSQAHAATTSVAVVATSKTAGNYSLTQTSAKTTGYAHVVAAVAAASTQTHSSNSTVTMNSNPTVTFVADDLALKVAAHANSGGKFEASLASIAIAAVVFIVDAFLL